MSVARPFIIAIPDARLDQIITRARSFDWDGFPDAGGWSAGIAKDELRRIVERWTDGYDWRAEECRLNALPQFKADVGGQHIHFVHIRGSGGEERPPLLLLHGWPGSFVEFLDAAARLAFPERFGGNAADGFDLIIPSLPGYGFSGRPAAPIGVREIARSMHGLMTDILGYNRYVAQGGDWGSSVAGWMAHDYPEACAGLHVNMAIMAHPGAELASEDEKRFRAAQLEAREAEGGYAHIQRTRPQSLGFALDDSPVGAAAWILEKFAAWSDIPRSDGLPDLEAVYSIDHLLTNIMIYVATGTMTTSAWLYFGNAQAQGFQLEHPIAVPTAMAAFPDPVFPSPPRSLVKQSYRIVRWTDMPCGGHFAAMEQPALFADDLRAFALSLG